MPRSLVLFLCLLPSADSALASDEGKDFFETNIRPRLVEHCYACHSAEAERKSTLKGELRLDTRTGVLRGGSSGPAVVPGDVEESLLISALRHESFEMPPTRKLPDAVIADFVKWVEMGAPDPRDTAQPSPRSEADDAQARQHWAFQPIDDPAPPDVSNTEWPRDDLDRFILARLEAEQMEPAASADLRTLVRRASYDLIGLPPTLDEIKTFARSGDLSAYASVVDALLESPHFGVHWARFWLDNVRYTDDDYTCGAFRTNEFDATPYRDWVVRAFNDDLPYDEFVRLQVAGDLIPHEDPTLVNADGITATGVWSFPNIVADNDPDKVLVDFVDQQIDVLGRTFLGLTLACARCHDHKFDPISQQDYYGLAGVFLSSHSLSHANPETGEASPARAAYRVLIPVLTTTAEQHEHEQRMSEIAQLQSQIKQLKQRNSAAFKLRNVRQRIKYQSNREVESEADKEDRDSTVARLKIEEEKLFADIDPAFLAEGADEVYAEHDQLVEQVKQLQQPLSDLRRRPAMREGGSPGTRFGGTIGDVPVFVRGRHDQFGDVAPRGFPPVLCWREEPPIDRRSTGSGRGELAEWLVDPRHPLTARVMVNRIWQRLFGAGLVRTPSNFGVLGARPTHPLLLDHLASRFVESGWSIKSLLREIMLSATYRQDSLVTAQQASRDPDNLLCGRMTRKRLSGEQLYDTMQELAGEMHRGVSDDQLRESGRALYLKVTRVDQPEQFRMQFDGPDPSLLVPRRSESTAATQALFLLNDPLMLTAAERCAQRLQKVGGDDRDRIDRAFREIYGRPPSDEERRVAVETVAMLESQWRQTMTDEHLTLDNECAALVWRDLCHVLLCGSEFLYVD